MMTGRAGKKSGDKLKDRQENRLELKATGQLWLTLAVKPKSGPQSRFLGYVTEGVWKIERRPGHWHQAAGCWYVNHQAVKHSDELHFKLIQIEGVDGRGRRVAGYITPEELLYDPKGLACYSNSGYELQRAVKPEMLHKTPDLARQAAREIERQKRIPPGQISMFSATNAAQ